MNIQDQLNRAIYLKSTPKRIVSLVPSQTELLVDLDLETSLVGVTKFCVHPHHLKKYKTVVGGTKQIKFDKIKALQPDIILCNKEENTRDIVEACEQICPVHVSDIKSIDDCLAMILQYGQVFKKETKALEIHQEIQKKLDVFKSEISNTNTIKVAYCIWKDPWMVAGKETFINALLELNNFENVFSDQFRYPEITLEDMAAKEVQLVLLSSEPFPFKNKHILEIEKGISKPIRIQLVDGELFSWYGSRLLKAFDYFKQLRQGL
jgi:ABC-type Fe3+-hydroxamate transport system substrate-binding protein